MTQNNTLLDVLREDLELTGYDVLLSVIRNNGHATVHDVILHTANPGIDLNPFP